MDEWYEVICSDLVIVDPKEYTEAAFANVGVDIIIFMEGL